MQPTCLQTQLPLEGPTQRSRWTRACLLAGKITRDGSYRHNGYSEGFAGNTRVFYVHRAGQESRNPASNNPGIHSPGHHHNVRHVGRLWWHTSHGICPPNCESYVRICGPYYWGSHTKRGKLMEKCEAGQQKAELNTSLNARQLPL